MWHRLLVCYLVLFFCFPPQAWLALAAAQQPPPGPVPADPIAFAPPMRMAPAAPREETDRDKLRKAMHLASWQLRDIVKAEIPSAMRYWIADANALFGGYAHCASAFKTVPTDMATIKQIVEAPQKLLVEFLESRAADIGRLQTEHVDVDVFKAIPDLVEAKDAGRACQPIAPPRDDFVDLTGNHPEVVELNHKFLKEAGSGFMTPFFVNLSRKRKESPLTDVELLNWLGWMSSIRKFASLLARYKTASGRAATVAKLPEIVVSAPVGQKLAAILGDQVREVVRARMLAKKIMSATLAKQNAPRFVECGKKETECGVGHGEVPPGGIGGKYCYCDSRPDSSKLLDEEIVLILQSRDPENPTRVTHGAWLNAARRLGAKALMMEHATGNSFLPKSSREDIPAACRSAGDMQSYVELYDQISTFGKKEWEIQSVEKAVNDLEAEYRSGQRLAPVPPPSQGYRLYIEAQRIATAAIQAYARVVLDANRGTPGKEQAITAERDAILAQLNASTFAGRLRIGSYPSDLAAKLKLLSLLAPEDLARLSEGDWERHRSDILKHMVEEVVVLALTDAMADYLLAFLSTAKELPAGNFLILWEQVYRGEWKKVLERPDFAPDLQLVASEIAQAILEHPAMREGYDPDRNVLEFVRSRTRQMAPDMMDAAMTDVPYARAVSVLPTPEGSGHQTPVFLLNPSRPLDHQHLRKGIEAMASTDDVRRGLVDKLKARGYTDDWVARNFAQIQYRPDGTRVIRIIRSVDALAGAILEKFKETLEADPGKDRDWVARQRGVAIKGLKDYLFHDDVKAKTEYEKDLKPLAKRIYDINLEPLLAQRASLPAPAFQDLFDRVMRQVVAQDTILPVKGTAAEFLRAKDAHQAKLDGIALIRQVFQARVSPTGEILHHRVLTNPQIFSNYCLGLKDHDETKNCLKWLYPLKEANRPVLRAYFEARLWAQTEAALKRFLPFFGKGKPQYGGERTIADIQDEDARALMEELPTDLFKKGWYGYLEATGPQSRPVKQAIDAFLIDVSKQSKAAEHASKTIDQFVAFLKPQVEKKAADLKLVDNWIERVARAATALETAIKSNEDAQLKRVFPTFRFVVGNEYQDLTANTEAGVNAWVEKNVESGWEKALVALLTPSFFDFRNAVNDHYVTLSIPHPDPFLEITKIEEQLDELEALSADLERRNKFDEEAVQRIGRQARHLHTLRDRARHRLKAYQTLGRLLKTYLKNADPAKQALAVLDRINFQELWTAYFEDQFLLSATDAKGEPMEMTPRMVLTDLNEIARSTKGLLPLYYDVAKDHVTDLENYCVAGLKPQGKKAFETAYWRAIVADLEFLVENGATTERILNDEEPEAENYKAVAAAVERVQSLWELKVARDKQPLKEWIRTILATRGLWRTGLTYALTSALPSPTEFCDKVKAEAVAIRDAIADERKTRPRASYRLSSRYARLVDLSSGIFFHSKATFGPIAVFNDKNELVDVTWFRKSPYEDIASEKDKPRPEEETPAPAPATPAPPPDPVGPTAATRSLVEFSRLDIPVEAWVAAISPKPDETIWRLPEPPSPAPASLEARVEWVQRLPLWAREVVFRRVREWMRGRLMQPVAAPAPALVAPAVAPMPRPVDPMPPADKGKKDDKAPKGKKAFLTPSAMGKLAAWWLSLVSTEANATISTKSQQPPTMPPADFVGPPAPPPFVGPSAPAPTPAPPVHPVDRVATGVPPAMVTAAKESPYNTRVFLDGMAVPEIATEIRAGRLTTIAQIANALDRHRSLFAPKTVPERDYATWRKDIERSLALWAALKEKDPTWGVGGANLPIAFNYLANDIFELFFKYLPYVLVGQQIVRKGQGGVTGTYESSRTAFTGLSVPQKARVIEDIRSMYQTEAARVRVATAQQGADDRAAAERLGMPAPEAPAEGSGPGPYQTGETLFQPVSGNRVVSGTAQLAAFVYDRFLDKAPSERELGVYRGPVDWKAHCLRREVTDRTPATGDYNAFAFSWLPTGQRGNQEATFTTWLEDLFKEPAVAEEYRRRAALPRSGLRKRIWHVESDPAKVTRCRLVTQLKGGLNQFDENAKVSPLPNTYPMALANISWKMNPRRYGTTPEVGPHPVGQPLKNWEEAGLMKDLVDLLGINLKNFYGWEDLIRGADHEVHAAIAYSKRLSLIGIGDRRFANTTVDYHYTDNPDTGPDYGYRVLPVLPGQRSLSMPAATLQDYVTSLSAPATYLRYSSNATDNGTRPLYQQLASVQGRMVRLHDVLEGSPLAHDSVRRNKGNWDGYVFGGNPTVPRRLSDAIAADARAVGVAGCDHQEVTRLMLIRERYADFLEQVNQLVQKYGTESSNWTRSLSGNTPLLWAGWGLQVAQGWLGAITGIFGWAITSTAASELDEMLRVYAKQMGEYGWRGEVKSCQVGPRQNWLANAVWQATAIANYAIDPEGNAATKARNEKILLIIDKRLNEEVQMGEYQRGVKTVLANIKPKLQALCEAKEVDFTRTDDDFNRVKELIKESNVLYYDNLAKFLNEFVPGGASNDTWRMIQGLKLEKERGKKIIEGVGVAVNVLITVGLLSLLAGRNPAASRFSTSAGGRAASLVVNILIAAYFAYEIYDEMAEDYWAGQGRLEFLTSIRDTQIQGFLPLMKDDTGMLVDSYEDDLEQRRTSKLRWAWRIWLTFITWHLAQYGVRALRGGISWALQRTFPHTYSNYRLWVAARRLNVSVAELRAMTPQEAIARLHKVETEALAGVLRATVTDDVLHLSDDMAALLRRDVEKQIEALCKELYLDPRTLKPTSAWRWVGAPNAARLEEMRREAQSTLDLLVEMREQLQLGRWVTRDQVVFLLAGKDTRLLPGMGHPMYRWYPPGLMFTGCPPSVYYLFNPSLWPLGRAHAVVEPGRVVKNLLAFNYVVRWREVADVELHRAAGALRDEIAAVRRARIAAADEELAALRARLDASEIDQVTYDRLVKTLERRAARDRTDLEEVLAAMLQREHPLHHFFLNAEEAAALRASAPPGRVFTLGVPGTEGKVMTDRCIELAADFRAISRAGGITTDAQLLRAISGRDYSYLAREFNRPERVLNEVDPDPEAEPPAMPRAEPGAGNDTAGGGGSGPGPVSPTPPRPTGTAHRLPTGVEGNPIALGSLDHGACLRSAEPFIAGDYRGPVMDILGGRWSSQTLELAMAHARRAGNADLLKHYQIAHAYTRAMEAAAESARLEGNLARAQAYYEHLFKLHARDLRAVFGRELSLNEAKAILGIDVEAATWTRLNVTMRSEQALAAARGDAEARLVEQARDLLIRYSPETRVLLTVEDYARVLNVPVEFFESRPVLQGLLTDPSKITRANAWLGRPLTNTEAQRLVDFFTLEVRTQAEARRLLGVSADATADTIATHARTLRASFEPRSRRNDPNILRDYGVPRPETELWYDGALRRVNEAERLLAPPSAPPGVGRAPAPTGPGSGLAGGDALAALGFGPGVPEDTTGTGSDGKSAPGPVTAGSVAVSLAWDEPSARDQRLERARAALQSAVDSGLLASAETPEVWQVLLTSYVDAEDPVRYPLTAGDARSFLETVVSRAISLSPGDWTKLASLERVMGLVARLVPTPQLGLYQTALSTLVAAAGEYRKPEGPVLEATGVEAVALRSKSGLPLEVLCHPTVATRAGLVAHWARNDSTGDGPGRLLSALFGAEPAGLAGLVTPAQAERIGTELAARAEQGQACAEIGLDRLSEAGFAVQ